MKYEEIVELIKSSEDRLDELKKYPEFTLKSKEEIEKEKEWQIEMIKYLKEKLSLLDDSGNKKHI